MGVHTVRGMDSYYEPDDSPELPDGCWCEDEVTDVKEAITHLFNEPIYENGKMDDGISVRFLARMTLLKHTAGMIDSNDPMVVEAKTIVEERKEKA